jgi:hypothetical protein
MQLSIVAVLFRTELSTEKALRSQLYARILLTELPCLLHIGSVIIYITR